MNHPTAHELLDRFNEIERGRQMKEKDENDALTISYMMGAESANDKIRALKKRIAELEAQEAELKKKIEMVDSKIAERIAELEAQVEEYKENDSERMAEMRMR